MRVAVAALVLLLLACFAPSASASPIWLSPTTFTEAGAELPNVAANPSGDSAAVWLDGTVHGDVRAIFRPAGGPVVGPTTLGTFDNNPAVAPSEAVVAVNTTGNAVAFWRTLESGHSIIQESFRPAGGDWGPAEPVTPPNEFNGFPQVQADGSGGFVAMWANGEASAQAAVSRAGPDGQFGPPEMVGGGAEVGLNLAINANGDAAVAWVVQSLTTSFVQVATAPSGGSFGPEQQLSPETENASVAVPAVAPDGRTTVVWTQFASIGTAGITEARTDTGLGTSFGDTQILSAQGLDANQPDVSVDGSGNVTAAWDQSPSPIDLSNQIVASTLPSGGTTWTGRQIVETAGTGGEVLHPELAAAQDGSAILAWESTSAVSEIRGAVRGPAANAFGGPQTLAEGGELGGVKLAVDGQGNGFATWFGNKPGLAQFAGFDAAGPVLSDVSVPDGGAGQSLAFSVSARDVWSGVSSVDWDFGDGSSGSGTSVTHTYAAPGAYPVVVRAVDGVGNATEVHRTVQVTGSGGGTGPAGANGSNGSNGSNGTNGAQGAPGIVLVPVVGPSGTPTSRVLISTAGSVVGHSIRIALACPASSPSACAGRVSLTSGNHVLAAGRFVVPAGRHRFVRLRLRSGASALLSARPTTSVKADIALARTGLPALALNQTVRVQG